MRPITVLDYLENASEKYAEKIAVCDADTKYTYIELNNVAKSIGAYVSMHAPMHTPVAIFMEKSSLHLAAMYGVLYAGCFYVPMDHKTPLERLESICETIETKLIITDEKGAKTLEKIGFSGDLLLVNEMIKYGQENLSEVSNRISERRTFIVDTDLMYLIFTSGSTGVPKGVAISHRAVMDYIDAFISQIGLESDDVCGNQAPFYTDFSLRDIYGSVAVGATVCIIPQSYFISPKRLLTYMDENKVSFLSWVPTAYRLVSQFDGLSKVKPGSIKKMLFSGESMPVPVYEYWKSHYQDAKWIQCYGPTEATGACCFYQVEGVFADTDTIPIGKPFVNTGIILLDIEENDEIISVNEVNRKGEICVFGTCLAEGYYNNPEKTKEAFVQNPLYIGRESKMYRTGDLGYYNENKDIVFVSRKDYQVKHGGKRIELGEIETAVMAVPEIKAACCVQRRSDDTLILYYTGDIDKAGIQKAVGDKIPKYMIPGEYIQKDELPMLESGKLNRKLMDEMVNS